MKTTLLKAHCYLNMPRALDGWTSNALKASERAYQESDRHNYDNESDMHNVALCAMQARHDTKPWCAREKWTPKYNAQKPHQEVKAWGS